MTPIELAQFEKLFSSTGPAQLPATPANATPAATAPAVVAPAPAIPAKEDKTGGQIEYATFQQVDLQTATILTAEKVEKSEKLIKLKVQVGSQTRQIVAGIAKFYTPESLVGRQVIVVANLKPAKLMGQTSEGMLLAAKDGDTLALLQPDKPVNSGVRVS